MPYLTDTVYAPPQTLTQAIAHLLDARSELRKACASDNEDVFDARIAAAEAHIRAAKKARKK